MQINYGSQKITINIGAIAVGLEDMAKKAGRETYKDLSEENKAIIAFGMAPVEVVESFSTQFGGMVTKMLKETVEAKTGIKGEGFYEIVSKDTIKNILTDTDREFYLGLLAEASDEGKLVV